MTAKDARDKAKKLAQKVLDLPEERIPVVSSVDWVRSLFDFNFAASVRGSTPPLVRRQILTCPSRRSPTLRACSPYLDGSRDTVLLFPLPTSPTA